MGAPAACDEAAKADPGTQSCSRQAVALLVEKDQTPSKATNTKNIKYQ